MNKNQKKYLNLTYIIFSFVILNNSQVPFPLPESYQKWIFKSPSSEQGLSGTIVNQAQLQLEKLIVNLDSSDTANLDYFQSNTLDKDISSYSMLVWTKLNNLTQRGGGLMTILVDEKEVNSFDSIVFAEETIRTWQIGSNGNIRNNADPLQFETNTSEFVFIALTAEDKGTYMQMNLYRNGEILKSYQAPNDYQGNRFLKEKTRVLFGIKNYNTISGTFTENGMFQGEIAEAQLFDYALPSDDIKKFQNLITAKYNLCDSKIYKEGYGCVECDDVSLIPPDCTSSKNDFFISNIDPDTYNKIYRQKVTKQCFAPSNHIFHIKDSQNYGTVESQGFLPIQDNAYYFEGTSAYRDFGPTEFGNTAITVSFWAKFEALNSHSRIIDLGSSGTVTNKDQFLIGLLGPTDKFYIDMYDPINFSPYGSHRAASDLGTIVQDEWSQFTVKVSSTGDISLYKNGIKLIVVVTNPDGLFIFPKVPRPNGFIGKSNWVVDKYFKGYIEELRIYDYELDEVQIRCMADKYAYCEYQCGQCEKGNPSTCITCSDSNRDLNNNCICKEGFIQVGTNPECQPQKCQVPWDYLIGDEQFTLYGTQVDAFGPGPLSGSIDTAMQFNGIDQYRDMGENEIGGELTFTVWAKWDQLHKWSRIFDFSQGDGLLTIGFANRQQLTENNVAAFCHDNDISTAILNFQVGAEKIELQQWSQWTVIFDANQDIRIYQNGGFSENTYLQQRPHSYPVITDKRRYGYLGKSSMTLNDDQMFEGSIQDFKVFNRVLSESEISCLSNINGHCLRQCLTCSVTYDNCNECIGNNRDLPTCECSEGFYENGENDCVSIFPCSQKYHTFKVLSVDTTEVGSLTGLYFHFNSADVDIILGRNDWNGEYFKVYNTRTGEQETRRSDYKRIRYQLFRNDSSKGGSIGDSYGKLEMLTIGYVDTQRYFQVGDVIDFGMYGECTQCQGQNRELPYCGCKEGFYYDNVNDDCITIFPCQSLQNKVRITDNNHSYDIPPSNEFGLGPGIYFHFYKEEVDRVLGRSDWTSEQFKVINSGDGLEYEVIIWRDNKNSGATYGDSHGRPLNNNVFFYSGVFQIDDYFIFKDQPNKCAECDGLFRQPPNCQCDFGWEENSLKECVQIIPTDCGNYVHIEATSNPSDDISFLLNGQQITLPQNPDFNHQGITIVELDESDFSIIQSKIFDVEKTPSDATALISNISLIQQDRIVLVGIANTAVGQLQQLDASVIQSLQTLGASQDLSINGYSSYVLVGKKGADQGSRPQMYKDKEPMINGVPIYGSYQSNQQSWAYHCLDYDQQKNPVIFHSCSDKNQMNMYSGINAWTDKQTGTDIYKYTNIYEPMLGSVYLQGSYEIPKDTPECTYQVTSLANAYIFHENVQGSERSGYIGGQLVQDGWQIVQPDQHNFQWLDSQKNIYYDMLIYTKQISTNEFIFPGTTGSSFVGGVSIKYIECHSSCLSCSGVSLNECTQCTINMELDNNNSCICMDQTYWNDQSQQCEQCHYSCNQCNGNSEKDCLTCQFTAMESDRTYNNNMCECPSSYYDEQNQQQCQQCNLKCISCIGPLETDCIIACQPQCVSCIQQAELCLICEIGLFRSLQAPYCLCKDGYYPVQNSQDCQQCPVINCKRCDSLGICLECLNNSYQIPNCDKHSKGSTVIVENGINKIVECDKQCETCMNSSSNCLSCSKGINRQKDTCLCKTGYHDENGQLLDCLQCSQTCIDCSNNDTCNSCAHGLNRMLDQFSGQCKCIQGYKQDKTNESLCIKCYEYQGDCVTKCPQNSYQDEKIFLCVNKMEEIENHTTVIYVGVCFIILFLMITSYFILKAINTNIRQLQQSNIVHDNLQNKANQQQNIQIMGQNNQESQQGQQLGQDQINKSDNVINMV